MMSNPVAAIFSAWEGSALLPLFSDAEETLARRQCIELVQQRATTLGIMPGEPVLIASGRGVRFFVDMLAVWWSAGIVVPYDPASDAALREHMLATVKASKVLDDRYALTATATPGVAPCDLSAADTCAFLFTSGSTGKPKAVELSVQALFGNAQATLAVLGMQRDRLFINIPFHFTSAICHFLACAGSGSTLLGYETKLIFSDFIATVAALQPSGIGGAPVQFRWLADAIDAERPEFLATLRFVMSSGDHFPLDVIAALRARAPSLQVFTVYGLTEVGGRFCILRPEQQALVPGSVGKPIAGLSVKVLDQDGVDAVPPGVVGEVVIEGDYVAKGYFGNAESTAKAFTAHGFRTGDLGYLDENGFLFLEGRADDVFKVNGAKVSGVVIAQALMQTDYFADAAVVPMTIHPFGTVPVAGVVLKAGRQLEKGAVRKLLRKMLPSNHMPHDIVALQKIPRTGSGKAQKGELKKLLLG